MTKKRKTFEFTHTLKKSLVSNCEIKTQILDLNVLVEVSYDGGPVHSDESYSVEDIHSVIYDGKNVWELVYMLDGMEDIETAALSEAMELFTSNTEAET